MNEKSQVTLWLAVLPQQPHFIFRTIARRDQRQSDAATVALHSVSQRTIVDISIQENITSLAAVY